ncbi:hypothetical protein BDE18_0396 [Paracoccus pantotrophus]|uniref:Uncharacterized protein n=1 Tax=Paracoccus pantotrophus TaxID=82367 RepID=A0AAE6NZP9_PARPN|nr:hypothetical protein [Paracoccus pantotrophus]QFG38317.1 hypothetical protein ESD82_20030 [Paracoccus pantotrophus]RKS51165.1 hypothetical protein BDE18_0396 [Paracoccus pantotrophus]
MLDEQEIVEAANRFEVMFRGIARLEGLSISEARGLFIALSDIVAQIVVSYSDETDPFLDLIRSKIAQLRAVGDARIDPERLQ